jgi:acetylornithine deacetylase/succinyl-diaminopimelate desuccinylase-like protein
VNDVDTPSFLEAVRSYRRQNSWHILKDFASLAALPNETHDLAALRVNAQAIADLFRARGAVMEVVERPGVAPLVVGRVDGGPALPTLGVYAHYDGQPAPPAGWNTPPFTPTLLSGTGVVLPIDPSAGPIQDDWRLFARGAADDKAPFMALGVALEAVRAARMSPRVNLVLCFEGEEESGSPHLADYLQDVADRLRADAWIICDGPVHSTGAPQVALGVRGYVGFELTVYGPVADIHSGHYGNWAPNPALDLVHLLASCKRPDGTVAIDGFYDTAGTLSDADRGFLDGLPRAESALLDRLGLAEAEMPGSRLHDRLMLPSFNIRGLSAGSVAPHTRNVIPATATASVDMRLAATDDPDRMIGLVRTHLQRQGYHVVASDPTAAERRQHRHIARLVPHAGYRGVRASADLPIVRHVAQAATAAAGQEALVIPSLGGSVPLYPVADVLRAPAIILPIANSDNNQHAANENLRLGQLWYGVDLWSLLLVSPLEGQPS